MKFKISLQTAGFIGILLILTFTSLYLFRLIVSQGITTKEIRITAKQFSFEPDSIRLSLNEQVRFRITSQDVTHGFSLPDFGIDQVIEPGKETIIDFDASKKGTFSFVCSVACGAGHSGMRGIIIIE